MLFLSSGGVMRHRFPWLPLFATALLVPWFCPAAFGAEGEDLTLSLGRPALQRLIAAATPYRLELGSSLLREVLTFSDPRDLRFQDGKISFSIRCQGAPFPVDQVLRPVLSLRPSGKGGYQAVVESLPLKIPGFGTVDLRDTMEPVEIQSLLRQTVFLQGRPAQLDVRVQRIVVRSEQIEMAASLTLKPDAPR
jgi:hypothetical protein